jgi:hypothetical protein
MPRERMLASSQPLKPLSASCIMLTHYDTPDTLLTRKQRPPRYVVSGRCPDINER